MYHEVYTEKVGMRAQNTDILLPIYALEISYTGITGASVDTLSKKYNNGRVLKCLQHTQIIQNKFKLLQKVKIPMTPSLSLSNYEKI